MNSFIFRCVGSIDIHVNGNRQTYKMIVIYLVHTILYTHILISLLGIAVYACMHCYPKLYDTFKNINTFMPTHPSVTTKPYRRKKPMSH